MNDRHRRVTKDVLHTIIDNGTSTNLYVLGIEEK